MTEMEGRRRLTRRKGQQMTRAVTVDAADEVLLHAVAEQASSMKEVADISQGAFIPAVMPWGWTAACYGLGSMGVHGVLTGNTIVMRPPRLAFASVSGA
jgi:hypothetical protein